MFFLVNIENLYFVKCFEVLGCCGRVVSEQQDKEERRVCFVCWQEVHLKWNPGQQL